MSPSINVTFGWIWVSVGLLVGAPMARAFLEPNWLGGFASRERRLLRLAHVAFIALGLINVVAGIALQTSAFRAPSQACTALAAGALLMPLFLLAAIRLRAALYALPLPFLLVFLGTLGLAFGRFAS